MRLSWKNGPVYAPDGDGALVSAPTVADPPAPADLPAPAPEPAAKPVVSEKLIGELTALRARNREAEARAAKFEREATEAKALADRLARGDKSQPAPAPAPATADDAEVDRLADYKLFLRDVDSMRGRGYQKYGVTFNETVKALGSVGAADDAFVQQVLAVDPDNAHLMLTDLAQDLERTLSIVNMSPAKRIAELTRISMAVTGEPKSETKAAPPAPAPAPAPAAKVSKAPAPAPAIDASASTVVDWRGNDKLSDAEWSAAFDRNMRERNSGRR